MDWRDLQTFLATAEAGSTQAASADLGLDQSTISRRIASFETRLGHRLFERLPTGLILTPAGEQMLDTARKVETDVHSLERRLVGGGDELEGEVRLTVPPYMLSGFLGEILSDYHDSHPDVHLDIDISMTEANLTKREADIAVRGSNTPPDHLIGRRAGTYHTTLYAREDLAKFGMDLPWIGWGEPGELETWARDRGLQVRSRIWKTESMEGQLALVRRGLGMAILPCPMADTQPDLARIIPDQTWPSRDVWVLTHKDLLASPRIRSLFNFLADSLRARKDLFEGRLSSAS